MQRKRTASITASTKGCLLVLVLSTAALSPRGLSAQPSARLLNGTVCDAHREPLKGAVVQVEDEQTGRISSYITDADGAYHFRRLSSDDDYKVWATYRGHKSRSREMSHFDSGKTKTISLRIRLD